MRALSVLLLFFKITFSFAQDSLRSDTSYCLCRDVVVLDTVKDIYMDVSHHVPFSASCRTNIYYHGSISGYYDLRYDKGKEVYVGIYDALYRKTSENRYLDNGCIKSLYYDTLGRLTGILEFKPHSRKSDQDFANGKLIYRENGVERLVNVFPDKWFIRMHHTEWDSSGRKTYNSFYRKHTIYFLHGRGHDTQGKEIVFRENGKRCLRLERIDDYEYKVCIIPPRKKRTIKLQ